MNVNPTRLALRFIGKVHERPGSEDDPLILAMLQMCDTSAQHDEVAWCSAFVHFIAWLLDLPRVRSLSARQWLQVGTAIEIDAAMPYADVVILARGGGDQPGPDVLAAPGHVGFFLKRDSVQMISIVGGNQSDAITVAQFPVSRVLGVRRLWTL